MRAIIVAAGRGRRLLPETEVTPKCLLDVGRNERILDVSMAALRSAGIGDITLITGFSAEAISRAYPELRTIFNPSWAATNILGSLMCAAQLMNQGFVVSYSDIIYEPATVSALLATDAELALAVDVAWRNRYAGRTEHPPSEAEKVVVSNGRVVKVGKYLDEADATGEFIGLAKVSARSAERLRHYYDKATRDGLDHRFHHASTLRNAYLTDMFEQFLLEGHVLTPSAVLGYWAEIDTPQDLAFARQNRLASTHS